jgi:rubredoxin
MTTDGWRCPNCGSTEHLEVAVTLWAKLEQTFEQAYGNEFQTEVVEGDHEWDGTSAMTCEACGWRGVASDARFTPGPSGCMTVTKGRAT